LLFFLYALLGSSQTKGKYIVTSYSPVQSNMGLPYTVLDLLKQGDYVEVIGIDSLKNYHSGKWSHFYKIKKSNYSGWVLTSTLRSIDIENASLKEQEKARQIQGKARVDELRKKYNPSTAELIINHKLQLGMTKDMVIESWGQPKNINKSVYSWGVHEQWVYDSRYLYFEDGILTSWQEEN